MGISLFRNRTHTLVFLFSCLHRLWSSVVHNAAHSLKCCPRMHACMQHCVFSYAVQERTYVDESGVVPLLQVVHHARLVQVRQAGHVFRLLKLRGIHLLRLSDVDRLRLQNGRSSDSQSAIRRLDECMRGVNRHAKRALPTCPSGISMVSESPFCPLTCAATKPSSS